MSADLSVNRIHAGNSGTDLNEPALLARSMMPKEAPPRINTLKELENAERKGMDVSISEHQIIQAIDRAIKKMEGAQTSLNFSVHEETKQIMVKVLDKETGEVIREIPPEKMLDFVAHLWQMAGILIDERT